jgi:hypothetical protein
MVPLLQFVRNHHGLISSKFPKASSTLTQLRFDHLIVGASTGEAKLGFRYELFHDLLASHILMPGHAGVYGGGSFIFVGAFSFFSALSAEETVASRFPSLSVVSAVGVDEIGVAALLIGLSTPGEAATTTDTVAPRAGATGF